MIRINSRLYSFVAILYVFLSLLGYQLATTMFLPISSDAESLSHIVTYPYRIIVFISAFILIVTSPSKRVKSKNRTIVTVYTVFMVVYLIRILLDIYDRDIFVLPDFKRMVLQYMFVAMIPAIWATIRSANYIDFERLNQWLMYGGVALMLLTILNQNSLIAIEYEEMTRERSNVAMGSLNLGYSCVTCFIIFFSWLVSHKNGKRIWKIIVVFFMLVSIVVMLRAASRGPFVTFVAILLFYGFSKMKNKAFGTLIILSIGLLVWVNMSIILEWLGNISPLMEQRMAASIYEEDSSGRDNLYANAIEIFLQNPIIGKQFVLDTGFYTHNSILDVMIGLGSVGALVWLSMIWNDFKYSYQNIVNKSSLMIISLISVSSVLKSFFSGAIYYDHKLVICLMLLFIMSGREEHIKSSMQS